jgi:hypothetical protein
VACIKTTQALADMPQDPLAAQLARFNFGQKSFHSSSKKQSSSSSAAAKGARAAAVAAARTTAFPSTPLSTDIEALPSAQGVVVLAQALCLMKVVRKSVECDVLRAVTALDTTSMLPQNAVIMQLSGLNADALPGAAPALLISLETEEGGLSTLHLAAALAGFGSDLPSLPDKCVAAMLAAPPDQQQLPLCPVHDTVTPYWKPSWLSNSSSSSSKGRKSRVFTEAYWLAQQQLQLQADPWLQMTPSSSTCADVTAQQQRQQQSRPGGSSSTAAASATRMLLSSCLGYDPGTYVAGHWLPQPDFFNSSSPCSSAALTAAAARSAARAAAPASAVLPITAPLVLADPATACKRLRNSAFLDGSIAVVKRGGCSFIEKAMAAATAGAYGVVVLNTESPGQLMTMSDDGSGRAPEVPTVMLEANDSLTLLFWLERRPLVGSLFGHSNPPAAGKAELISRQDVLHHQEQQRQQELQRQRKQKQRATGQGSEPGQERSPDEILQTRIDLFVPGRSQPWLQQNVIKAGIDGQTAYQSLARDPRVLQVLQGAYVRNKAHHNGLQQPLIGKRAASSVAEAAALRAQPKGHSGG